MNMCELELNCLLLDDDLLGLIHFCAHDSIGRMTGKLKVVNSSISSKSCFFELKKIGQEILHTFAIAGQWN
jgi:hypothetical protein